MKTRIYEDLADLYKLWRDTCLGESHSEKREAGFVRDVLRTNGDINTVIDLGGGIGLHSRELSKEGFGVTLFDQSEKALSIAQSSAASLKTVIGSFETIDLNEAFDASICMWSTLSYVPRASQKHFYSWISNHTKSLIILDEPNFSLYPSRFHKVYTGEDEKDRLKVTRDWTMTDDLKVTEFLYEVEDKATGEIQTYKDAETQQYVTAEELQGLLGNNWSLDKIYGDYDLKIDFIPESSSRMIFVFVPA